MKHLIQIHIHSCFACFASSDEWMWKKIIPGPKEIIFSKSHPNFSRRFNCLTDDEQNYFRSAIALVVIGKQEYFCNQVSGKVPGHLVYYASDSELYWKSLRSKFGRDLSAMENKIKLYSELGFQKEEFQEYKEKRESIVAIEDAKEKQRRREDGYVFPDGDANKELEEFQGGLSDEVFNDPYLQKYFKDGKGSKGICVFGYVGNSNRTIDKDKLIEYYLRHNLKWTVEEIGVWLTSSSGRHFCDSYEDANNLFSYEFKKQNC
jgi:hypothetical protein